MGLGYIILLQGQVPKDYPAVRTWVMMMPRRMRREAERRHASGAASTPVALTIAASDSGGGAGIQADLKTFAAFGVHGMSCVTAITAQDTLTVHSVHDVPSGVVRAQIRAVVEDLGVKHAKTGMLHTSEIVETVAGEIKRHGLDVVVDPVMVAKGGAKLLREDATRTLVERLLPLARVVTPNVPEAERLAGIRIRTREDQRRAARRIAELGPEAAVVKGGHLPGRGVVDVLIWNGELHEFRSPRIATPHTHGTGCCFSAAIAAGLARGTRVPDAVGEAHAFLQEAIRHAVAVGKGRGPVNPTGALVRDATTWRAEQDLRDATARLESHGLVARLIPESQSNIAVAPPWARSTEDVLAIPGRIVRIGDRVQASAPPALGASGHVARTLLVAREHDPGIGAAMNIRHGEDVLRACRALGLNLSSYDRGEEPEEIKRREGMTTAWGARRAIEAHGSVPDAIWHAGEACKEPMVVLLGRTAREIALRAIAIADALYGQQGRKPLRRKRE